MIRCLDCVAFAKKVEFILLIVNLIQQDKILKNAYEHIVLDKEKTGAL
jgi:hypothetical protein